jgi:beta-aspartyl-peptidase (threonine type)
MAKPAITPALIVHGGAGHFDEGRFDAAEEGCRRAVMAGLEVLRSGGSALDAAQAAVRVLEDEPSLNAGTGSSLNADGEVETDAAVMDGASRRLGAVASMLGCGNPIDVARAVLDDGRHSLLCGEGAWRFAREHGFEPTPMEALIQDYRRQQLADRRKVDGGGTVGACAVDANGHVAAATSTGGTTGKLPGRIGDTPLPGCGTWADPDVALSATGHGESAMSMTITRLAADRCRQVGSPFAALGQVIAELEAAVGGDIGLILALSDGRLAAAHNTTEMPNAAGFVVAGRCRLASSGVRVESDLEDQLTLT